MSAVARLLLEQGEVSGSDQGRWPLGEQLRSLGVTVHDTFDPSHLEGADVVVRSSAYGEDNPEVAEALRRGLTLWRRHDAWRAIALGKRVVAVSGTHGKTTTTALAWCALRAAGVDASLICGARLVETGTNAHAGSSDVLVIEADEYDRTFLALEPYVAVVTNVDHDHIDQFPTPGEYADAYRAFAARVRPGGVLVACAEDPGAAALARSSAARTVTYGAGGDVAPIDVPLRVAGRHNVLNATAAVIAATELGAPRDAALRGVAAFGGTERRLEELGSAAGVRVVDDYAHHPVEIAASIAAVRGRGRVVAVFQPHTTSRLDAFFDGFVSSLRGADAVVIAETFSSARELADERGRATALATALGAGYARDADDAARLLAEWARPGDTVLVLGAGDIRAAGVRLLALLRERAPV